MKKKILFLLPNLNYGGAEKVTINFFNYLNKKKFKKKLIIQGKKGPMFKKIFSKEKVVFFNSKRFIFFSFSFLKYIKNRKYDYVYSTLSHVSMFLLILKISGILKSKLIVRESNFIKNIINSSKIKFLLIIYYKLLYKKIDMVIASSKTIQNDIINITNIQRKKIIILYNPVEQIFFKNISNKKLSLKKVKFLSIGRLNVQKGYEKLLSSLNKLKKLEWELKIIGSGPKKKEIVEQIKKLKFNSKVKLVSKSNKIRNEIKKCDFYIKSSLWEGMPNSVLESLIMRKKVFFLNKIKIYSELKKIFPSQVFILKNNFRPKRYNFSYSKKNNLKKTNIFRIENTSRKFESILE